MPLLFSKSNSDSMMMGWLFDGSQEYKSDLKQFLYDLTGGLIQAVREDDGEIVELIIYQNPIRSSIGRAVESGDWLIYDGDDVTNSMSWRVMSANDVQSNLFVEFNEPFVINAEYTCPSCNDWGLTYSSYDYNYGRYSTKDGSVVNGFCKMCNKNITLIRPTHSSPADP